MTRKDFSRHFIPHFHDDGEHHRAHAINLPALFAYFQIFVLTVAFFYVVRVKAPQILGTANFTAEQIVKLTNNKRVENGFGALATNSQLTKAAIAKSSDMFTNNYWAHNSPGGKTPWSFITSAGYKYVFAGENLARDFNDAGSVVEAWMNSPTHRSNLLDSNFKEIGVAVVNDKFGSRDSILVVQMFGTRVSAVVAEKPLVELAQPPPQSAGQKVAEVIVEEVAQTEATVLATKQFSIAKGVALGLVSFIFLLFLIEVIVTIKRTNVSLRPGLVAHLVFLAFILFAVWYAVQGAVI